MLDSVRKIKAADDHAIDGSLDVTAVTVVGVARKAAACLARLLIPDKDRNAIPALLTMPDGAVAGTLDFPAGKLLVRRLEFLQTDDIRLRFGQPPQQDVEATVDAVDVRWRASPALPSVFAIAPVALAGLRIMLRVATGVGGKRSRDVDALLELPFLVTADVTFVGSGIDQFALAHGRTPLRLLQEETHAAAKRCTGVKRLAQTRKTSAPIGLSH